MGAKASRELTISPARKVAASGALVAGAAVLGAMAIRDTSWINWSLLAFSGVVAAAGVGLSRTSMVAQVLSRATGWMVFAPSFLVAIVSALADRHPEPTALALAAASGGALLLARPMLHTKEARAQFSPTSFRRWLFASATASATTGITASMIAFDSLRHSDFRLQAVAAGMMGLSLVASAIGVVRMRAWGMLLGAATSLVTLLAAAILQGGAGFVLAMAAVPGLMMTLPILLTARSRARDRAERERERGARVRIADDTSGEVVLARYRIADDRLENEGAEDRDAAALPEEPARAARIA